MTYAHVVETLSWVKTIWNIWLVVKVHSFIVEDNMIFFSSGRSHSEHQIIGEVENTSKI